MKKKIPGIKETKNCYIYLLSNSVNKKYYVGYTDNPDRRWKEHLSLVKLGSKLQIHKAMRKYGVECFKMTILFEGTDPEVCLNEKEPFFINQYNSFKRGYNATLGGENPLLGRIMITDGINNKLITLGEEIPAGWRVGLTTDHSWMEGSQPITNGIENKRLRKEEVIPEGWVKGATHRNPTKPIFKDGVTKRIPHTELVPKGWILGSGSKPPSHKDHIYITDGKTNKRLYKDSVIPEGWHKGFTQLRRKTVPIHKDGVTTQHPFDEPIPEGWRIGSGKNPPNHKGYICITDGKINKTIPPNETIPEGWYRGRLKKKKDGTYN